MSDIVILEPVLGLTAAAALKSELLAHRGKPVQVDASNVQRLGGLCLQVLVAGARLWAEEGRPFSLTPRSEAFAHALNLFGATAQFENASAEGVAP